MINRKAGQMTTVLLIDSCVWLDLQKISILPLERIYITKNATNEKYEAKMVSSSPAGSILAPTRNDA